MDERSREATPRLSERENAAIWDYIDSGSRDLTIGPRERAVIGCTCRRPYRDPLDYQRDHHEPGCVALEGASS